jgi:hypothetical protein
MGLEMEHSDSRAGSPLYVYELLSFHGDEDIYYDNVWSDRRLSTSQMNPLPPFSLNMEIAHSSGTLVTNSLTDDTVS